MAGTGRGETTSTTTAATTSTTVDQARAVRASVVGWAESLSTHVVAAADARELLNAAVAIKHAAATVEGIAAQVVAGSVVWRKAGDRSAAHFLARVAGTSVGDAKETLSTAERLGKLPATQDAALRGELSPRQSSLISGAAVVDPNAEAALLSASKATSLGELTQECAKRRAAADPDPDATRARIHRGRYLRTHTDAEGAWNLHARATVDIGARIMAALAPFTEERFHEARRAGAREPLEAYQLDALTALAESATAGTETFARGTATPGVGSARANGATANGSRATGPAGPAAGRGGPGPSNGTAAGAGPAAGTQTAGSARAARSQATGPPGATGPTGATGLTGPGRAGQGAATPDGGTATNTATTGRPRRRPPAKIIVRIDMDALLRGRVLDGETSEIAGVGPVPVSVVRDMLASDNPFLAAVVTKGKAVAGVVHLGRKPTRHQVTALEWQSPTCAVLGCPNSSRLEIDHVEDWADTHVTRIEALERICAYHHWFKTTQGWALVSGVGKRPIVSPNDPRHPKNVTARNRRLPRRGPGRGSDATSTGARARSAQPGGASTRSGPAKRASPARRGGPSSVRGPAKRAGPAKRGSPSNGRGPGSRGP